jgi:hypothetical protein
MAKITEKLPQETLDNLVSSQTKTNELIFTFGQLNLRIRDLENEVKRLSTAKAELETQIDESANGFNNIVAELELKYPKGEVDLNEGIVIYETEEK